MLSIEAMLYELRIWVQHIKDEVCIVLACSSEHHYLIVGEGQCPKELEAAWPKPKLSLCGLKMDQSFI